MATAMLQTGLGHEVSVEKPALRDKFIDEIHRSWPRNRSGRLRWRFPQVRARSKFNRCDDGRIRCSPLPGAIPQIPAGPGSCFRQDAPERVRLTK